MFPIPVLLLLALPAAGKSEIRRYLEHVDPGLAPLPLGTTIQLDDYPYVHVMRRISEEQRHLGIEPVFFTSEESSFRDPRDWLTLIHLVDDDFGALSEPGPADPDPVALIDRIDAARHRAGIHAPALPSAFSEVAAAIADDAADLAAGLPRGQGADLASSTVIIEFARGGPEGASPPLPDPLGYRSSLAALSPSILERAAILYVWVTPDESLRRNRERAVVGSEGDASILHHGVPESVMRDDYGMDDMDWLERTSPVPGTVAVDSPHGGFGLPVARFDNRADRTSFLREDPSRWAPERIAALHADLASALGRIDDAPPSPG